MNVFARSMGNAFRNKVRSAAVIVILAVAIGLALSMLVANQAVARKVEDLKASVGTTITINPAGARGFQGGGEPLTADDADTAAGVEHVNGVTGSLSLQLSNEDAEDGTDSSRPGPSTAGTTSLDSAVEPGTIGNRNNGGNSGSGSGSDGTDTDAMPSFSMPITATGIESALDADGEALNITDSTAITDYGAASGQAVLGTSLAEKNGLSVGGEFTAMGRTFTVTGIYDAGTEFDNNALYLPLAAAQELSGQDGELSVLAVTVDNIENVEAARTALQDALGSDRADVALGSNGLSETIDSLSSVQSISLIGFIAALVTAGLIVLLIMIMVVRERRREIGVLKAIGATNRSVAVQFVLEALVLVLVGALIGTAVAFLGSGPIANALVDSGSDTGVSGPAVPGDMPDGGPGAMDAAPGSGDAAAPGSGDAAAPGSEDASGQTPDAGPGGPFGNAVDLVGDVTTAVGPGTVALGLLGVLFIAALGALVPALLTARVRPVEVLRGE